MRLLHELLTGDTQLHESVEGYRAALEDAVAKLKEFGEKYPDADSVHGIERFKGLLILDISENFKKMPDAVRKDLKNILGNENENF